MMKKYNTPEIVTLALEAVDVIETSGGQLAEDVISAEKTSATMQMIPKQITNMSNKWSW